MNADSVMSLGKQLILGLGGLSSMLMVKPPAAYFTEEQGANRPWVIKPQSVQIEEVEVEEVVAATVSGEIEGNAYTQVIEGMWAGSYDSSCAGCSDTTATGMKQGYGVVAVDPKVIPLYTRVYVPGYGVGVAGDVGGGVKGKIIDLGYDKLEGQWSARYVDVYILAD